MANVQNKAQCTISLNNGTNEHFISNCLIQLSETKLFCYSHPDLDSSCSGLSGHELYYLVHVFAMHAHSRFYTIASAFIKTRPDNRYAMEIFTWSPNSI